MKFKLPDELIFITNGRAVQKKSEESMKDKVCIVTGSTSGVGLEATRRLAKGGANIVMVCRNRDKANKVKEEIERDYKVSVDIFIADFSKLDQVRKAAMEIVDSYETIDVLINSVGIHSTKRTYNENGIEMVFCVNHLSTFLFTYLLLDKLKENNHARIIHVNSEGHRFGGINVKDVNWKKCRLYTGLRSYAASKTAQLLTVLEFADYLKDTNVTINAMHPGAVKTNIGSNNGWLYKWFLRNVTWHFLKDPQISGEAIYYLASSPELKEVTGKFYNLTIEEKTTRRARNRKVGKQVWHLSMEMAGLNKKTE